MTKKDNVINFLKSLTEYVCGDLETFQDIHPDFRGKKGCGVGEVLTCFAVIDVFGFLYNDNPQNKPVEHLSTDNNSNLSYALTSPELFLSILPHKKYAGTVIQLFRHALVHHYLPRQIGLLKPTSSKLIRAIDCFVKSLGWVVGHMVAITQI